jgi:hypothetical protein
MTIGVAARFPGGVVIGADSRLNVDEKQPDDDFPKAFRIPGKRVAIAVAGEMGLTVKLLDEEDPVEVMDFVSLVRCGLQHVKRDSKDVVRDSVNALHRAAMAIGYTGKSVQVVVGEIRDKGPTLWMIEHYNSLGTTEQPKERGQNPPYLGVGKFGWYSRLASDKPFPALTSEEADRKKRSAPPPLPNRDLPDEASAEQWVREVIGWCCAQYEDCGGQPVIHVVK